MSDTIRECQVCHRYIAEPGKQVCRKCWRAGLYLDPLLDKLSAASDAHADPEVLDELDEDEVSDGGTTCPVCHGRGIEWDGPEPCEHCDGEGYEWWR